MANVIWQAGRSHVCVKHGLQYVVYLCLRDDVSVILSIGQGYFYRNIECVANGGSASSEWFPLVEVKPVGVGFEYVRLPLITYPFSAFLALLLIGKQKRHYNTIGA